ncbi:nitrous oxide reductase accessory protein NosL [Aquibacillus koreensis]|uniref:Nitrous oxide reductase accessory protein NosL n=1 Tax=Aquibacillus koreensis TaxID=279446 RepID=A0A9X3WLM4_9BACI|nr:nitrous oxide reductase accessory protein NosL [Aquibacillus koreensis]MCT2536496.1 nitrous oxide reductase accessory protein NosL [Aquibacillus koreensis]MDC3419416.1 nitrous oxide reductase accessory protein NosL [Aquibacillus koreensis]
MKISKILGLLLLSFILLAGCGNNEVEPVAIDESTDTCAICNMQVKDSAFATQVILSNEKVHVFDDIGCMYTWFDENESEEVAAQFVRDYHTKEWIEGDQATYVFNPSIQTPMSYNVVSFESAEDAEQFIAENEGNLLSYDDLQNHAWAMSMDMEEHSHGEEHAGEEGHSGHEDHADETDTEMDMNHDSETNSDHEDHE